MANDENYIPFNGRQPGENDDEYSARRGKYIEDLKSKLNENVAQQKEEGRDQSPIDEHLRADNRRVGRENGWWGWKKGEKTPPRNQKTYTDDESNQARASKDLPKQPAPEVTKREPGKGEWYLDDDGLMKRY